MYKYETCKDFWDKLKSLNKTVNEADKSHNSILHWSDHFPVIQCRQGWSIVWSCLCRLTDVVYSDYIGMIGLHLFRSLHRVPSLVSSFNYSNLLFFHGRPPLRNSPSVSTMQTIPLAICLDLHHPFLSASQVNQFCESSSLQKMALPRIHRRIS